MGWGQGPGAAGRGRLTWSNDEWNAASALCAAQLPLVWLAWWFFVGAGQDDYGRGGGAFGVLCVPLILPLLGVVHSSAQIMPAATLSRLLPRRLSGPAWAWHVVASVLVGAGWAVLAHGVWGWSLGDTLPWFAGAGVLPVLILVPLRRRAWGGWSVWLRSAGACFVLFVVGGLSVAALADDYEPPRLSAGQLAGEWRGADGAVLRLAPGGAAELIRVPAQPDFEADRDYTRCDGTGTWARDRYGDRDAVLVRLDGECGEETHWTISGTGQAPELFALFGDPDAGDLRILTRDWDRP
ncbi:hypothetical protein KBZ94_00960 [Streptomyces sp. RM72]|uniref:hypothetical protein n=1 Tax=Streptomyces sp. RM72 TaxID=1115510 RepID=UPI001B369BA4|nr:hypothetical protein [Streptomyces sp. RM72]MBQ0883508.1 hypothetical protein [Streptomyces sp. RM72]